MKKSFEIELDEVRLIRFDTNAVCELENDLGMPVTALNDKTIGIKTLRQMLWRGLKWQSPKLTIAQTGDLIDAAVDTLGIDGIAAVVVEALQHAISGGKK